MRQGSGRSRYLSRKADQMNSLKAFQWSGLVVGVTFLLLSAVYSPQYFSNTLFLGGILAAEVVIASLWRYEQRFLVLIMVIFLWSGMRVPMQSIGTQGRWVVLSAGALVGCIIWFNSPRRPFQSMHLIAGFCIFTAFISATVSPLLQMASLKAVSLFLLFLYCSAGVRLALFGREVRFFHGLLSGVETAVYGTAICEFGLSIHIWGNPNSLGAAMSIACFPILLWGWLTSDEPVGKARRLGTLLLCTYLVHSSGARAGMAAVVLVTAVFCVCLRQYKLLAKATGFVLCLVAIAALLGRGTLDKSLQDLKAEVLYKGHDEQGVLGSRQPVWDVTIASIKAHPFFGTGYGTSMAVPGQRPDSGNFSSTWETAREHGSSYMTIIEWVGLLGVVPFFALLATVLSNLWKVCVWMNRSADPRHYSIPLAMVVLAGLVHASFEDWLFAVGSYLSLYFWVCAFLLADILPDKPRIPSSVVLRTSHPLQASLGVVESNR
jgi:O-antigen ligase